MVMSSVFNNDSKHLETTSLIQTCLSLDARAASSFSLSQAVCAVKLCITFFLYRGQFPKNRFREVEQLGQRIGTFLRVFIHSGKHLESQIAFQRVG